MRLLLLVDPYVVDLHGGRVERRVPRGEPRLLGLPEALHGAGHVHAVPGLLAVRVVAAVGKEVAADGHVEQNVKLRK